MANFTIRNIPEKDYAELQVDARQKRRSINAEMLSLLAEKAEMNRRLRNASRTMKRIKKIREEIAMKYPNQPDSVDLIREDRGQPMNFVLDASVAAKWLLAEADSDKASALFQAWTGKQIRLLGPEILPAEVCSALWKRVMRGLLPAAEAMRLQSEFIDLGIPLHPTRELVDAAFDLALRFRHSVYDGLYVALALKTGANLVTADEKLFRLASPGSTLLLHHWK